MTLPRDLSGDELARLLRRNYGYRAIRQRGSHLRLASSANFAGRSIACRFLVIGN